MRYKRLEIKNQPTFIIGDIHGDYNMLLTRINADENVRMCNLIIAGDIGLGFNSLEKHLTEFQHINKVLTEKGITLYLIRGNHDDPSYFIEHKVDMPNIITLEDYTILTCGETNILCVGGAISIDRTYRIKKYEQRLFQMERIYQDTMTDYEILRKVIKGYWEDEIPYYNEEALNEIKVDNIPIHYIITHTSPNFAFKADKKGIEYWLSIDSELNKDLDDEREVLSKIYHKVLDDEHPLKEWIYGHFHEHWSEDILNVKFTALANSDYIWDIKPLTLINN